MTSSNRIGVGVLFLLSLTLLVAHAHSAQDPRNEAMSNTGTGLGRTTFRQFCAPCHGLDAKGQGPVGRLLLTKPADLTRITQRHQGKFPVATLEQMLTLGTRTETEAHGSEQMPIWGPTFRGIDTDDTLVKMRVANLIRYLESIQE